MSQIPDPINKHLSDRRFPSLNEIFASRTRRTFLTKTVSYIVLFIVVLFMILPLVWLINGSFQPAWQINADPVIWIPRQWLT
jgi:ABC-type glycerol-3-phosphate transport system permease component